MLDPLRAGAFEAGGAGAADPRPTTVMLVIGGDVADRSVQPHRVVLASDPRELAVEHGWVAELSSGGNIKQLIVGNAAPQKK